MRIYTIGFTKKTARQFFTALKEAGIQKLIDVRLNNTSQLAAFAKRDDLAFFLQEICGAEYIHMPMFAPTQDILDRYKKKEITWEEYERLFRALIAERRIELTDKGLFAIPTVLLCSEPSADKCHRRLVAEYLRDKWDKSGGVEIVHL